MKARKCSHATGDESITCDLVTILQKELQVTRDDLALARMDLDFKIQQHNCLLGIQEERELQLKLLWDGRKEEFRKKREESHTFFKRDLATIDELIDLRGRMFRAAIQNLRQAFQADRDHEISGELRIAELVSWLSKASCLECGQAYRVDPSTGAGCVFADHLEAFAAISGK